MKDHKENAEVEITVEQQIEMLQLRIKELQEQNLKLKETEDRFWITPSSQSKPLNRIGEYFGFSEEQEKELTRFCNHLLFNHGDIIEIFARIENAPIPLREKMFCVHIITMKKSPRPGGDFQTFMRMIMPQ